jgi:hypothetical protein
VAQIRSSRWWIGLTAILATVFLGTAATLTFWGWPRAAGSGPEPSQIVVTVTPTSTEIVHPAPLDAWPLTASVLESVNEDWILVEYDSSAGRFGPPLVAVTPSSDGPTPTASPLWVPGEGSPEWEIPGQRYLYVVDPSGAAFEAARLGVSSNLRLVGWLPDRRTAIVEEAVGGGVALHTIDLITGELSDRFPGPNGAEAGTWIDPEVRLSTDVDGLVVVYGARHDTRGITRIGFDGTPVSTPVEPIVLGGFIQSPDGTILVVAEGGGESDQAIVSYAAPGTSIFPEPSPSASPTATPVASPVASNSGSPAGGGYERYSHGLPAGEEDCTPVSWPEDRQILIACTHEDGVVVLYTLALMTSTFVDVTTVPFDEDEPFLTFNDQGTRIARGTIVINRLGETVWSAPSNEPTPRDLRWAGEFLITWGDAEAIPKPGYEAPSITARHSSRGDLSYVLQGNPGAAGFGVVVAAP